MSAGRDLLRGHVDRILAAGGESVVEIPAPHVVDAWIADAERSIRDAEAEIKRLQGRIREQRRYLASRRAQ